MSLKARLKPLATRRTARSALEKFAGMQMLDAHLPTTDGCELLLAHYPEPDAGQRLLFSDLR